MRIPPSLIVMSIATAVPFGLAIRDTVNGAPQVEAEPDDYAATARAEQAQYEAEQAAERELEEKQRAALVAKLGSVYGATPASMGSLLAGVTFGQDVEFEGDEGDLYVALDHDSVNNVVRGVNITVPDDNAGAACDELRAKLIAAWGPPTGQAWVAADGSQRATLDECELAYEPTLAAPAWLDAVYIIGMPAAKVEALPSASVDTYGVGWYVPGIGYASGRTSAYATLAKGKVTYVSASGDTDFDSLVQIRDAVSAKLKSQPSRDDETGDWVWKKAPTAVLHRDADSDGFTLTIGKDESQ